LHFTQYPSIGLPPYQFIMNDSPFVTALSSTGNRTF
jgi:hypothetical protein